MEDDEKYQFNRILDYAFENCVLKFKTRYLNDAFGEHDLDVPFPILKKDVPVKMAKFIRDNIVEDKRGGFYNTWAKNTLKVHAWGVRRLHRIFNIEKTICTRRAKTNRISKNARNEKAEREKNKEKA